MSAGPPPRGAIKGRRVPVSTIPRFVIYCFGDSAMDPPVSGSMVFNDEIT